VAGGLETTFAQKIRPQLGGRWGRRLEMSVREADTMRHVVSPASQTIKFGFNFAHLGFQYCDSSVTRRRSVVQHTQIAIPSDERRRQAVQRELAAFEKLENDLNARERKERAAKLGLGLVLRNFSPKETSTEQQG
jgi:hypothetical protein